MQEELKAFCKNYETTVVNDTGRYARYRAPKFFSVADRADIVDTYADVQTEKLYTLQIPESRLQTLIEMERRFFNASYSSDTNVGLFDVLISKEREESFYRNTNAAVRKAYEHYSMLLNLAGHQQRF